MTSRYASLSREQLAVLVPELLLIGQMIDRSGMAWCVKEFGHPEMLQIAIEEWMGSSPIYTKRMQKALRYEGDDVITIFKGLQLDIGAPPQFMDFRYTVHDRWHGEFHLDHCGALLDVEPMGEDYVRGMCHDIEDPTFDATAVATRTAPGRSSSTSHIPKSRIIRCSRSCTEPARRESISTRSIPTTRDRWTTRANFCRTSTSVRSPALPWCVSRTRCACRCTC
jgi:hypothetical protein